MAINSDFSVKRISYILDGEETSSDNFYNGMVSPGAESVNLYISSIADVGEVRIYYYTYEKEVLLPADWTTVGNKITITPLISFKDGKKHKIEYRIENEVYETVFNVSESYDHLLYYHNNFDEETKLSVSANGCKILRENSKMIFEIPEGTYTAGFADIYAQKVAEADEYIIEMEICIEALTNSAYLKLFDAKNENSGWRLGAKVCADGKIRMNDTVVVGTWSKNVPFTYSAIYNTKSGFCNVYINGNQTAENIYVGTTIFIEIHQGSPIGTEIKLENVKLSSYERTTEDVNISFYKSENTLNLNASLNESKALCNKIKIFVCQYNAEDTLVGVKICNISEVTESISEEITLSESVEYVKSFACNADNILEVITTSDIFEIN